MTPEFRKLISKTDRDFVLKDKEKGQFNAEAKMLDNLFKANGSLTVAGRGFKRKNLLDLVSYLSTGVNNDPSLELEYSSGLKFSAKYTKKKFKEFTKKEPVLSKLISKTDGTISLILNTNLMNGAEDYDISIDDVDSIKTMHVDGDLANIEPESCKTVLPTKEKNEFNGKRAEKAVDSPANNLNAESHGKVAPK